MCDSPLILLQDTVILYNIALILQKLASQLLRDEKSTLEEVLQVLELLVNILLFSRY